MNTPNSTPSVRQEEDILPPRLIVYVIFATVGFALLIVVIATGIWRFDIHQLRPSGQFSEMWLGPIVERSNVYEELYGAAGPGQMQVQEARASLEKFVWVDRDKGIVRVPIDKAIQMYVNAQQP